MGHEGIDRCSHFIQPVCQELRRLVTRLIVRVERLEVVLRASVHPS